VNEDYLFHTQREKALTRVTAKDRIAIPRAVLVILLTDVFKTNGRSSNVASEIEIPKRYDDESSRPVLVFSCPRSCKERKAVVSSAPLPSSR
jgi:hypothetical protein